MNTQDKPVVAVTLGDPAGIGAELIARLLARPETLAAANVVLVGDPWLWADGQQIAGLDVATDRVASFTEVRGRTDTRRPAFLPVNSVAPEQVERSQSRAAGGNSVLQVLDLCMDAALARHVDAICFAPLNKLAMKLGGLKHEDELHHFAEHLGVTGYFCEFYTIDALWTCRISSHVPRQDVPKYVTRERVLAAASLIHRSLQANGVAAPRVGRGRLQPAQRGRRHLRPPGSRHHRAGRARTAGPGAPAGGQARSPPTPSS